MKLLAEWFWTDRWMGSSAFLLPMEARGLYREMLTQAWRRGAALPNDHAQIQRATGCTAAEWRRAWPRIEHFWRVDGALLVNDTQVEVYRDAVAREEAKTRRGKAGADARWGAQEHAQASSQARGRAPLAQCPPSPISEVQEPPKPPSAEGGRLTRAERSRAEQDLVAYAASQPRYVAPVHREAGRDYPEPRQCPHEPQCDDREVCLALFAADRRDRVARRLAERTAS